jgi:hypothetical protein
MADDLTPQVETPQAPATDTWDSVTAQPSPPPVQPPAESAPLEKPADPPPPELDAQSVETPAVREGESQPPPVTEPPKDEYVAEADDPPELAALNTPGQRDWAKRQFKEAEAVRKYLTPDEPIQRFGDDLYQRSPSRYWEHVDSLVDLHADDIVERLLGVKTLAEAKTRLQSQPDSAQPPVPQPAPQSATLTETDLANLSDTEVLQRFEAAKQAERGNTEKALRADFDAKFNDLKAQFETVNGKFTTQENAAREQQVVALESELKTNVLKVVQDGIRESGLEPKTDDPPRIASLKQAALKLINTQFEPTFDADDDNVKVVDRVLEFANRLERANVFREEDNLKIRARSTFEKLKQSPEVKAVLDEINAFVEQSKAKPPANDPAPPVSGAAAGFTIKPPTNWDEAIAQAKSA